MQHTTRYIHDATYARHYSMDAPYKLTYVLCTMPTYNMHEVTSYKCRMQVARCHHHTLMHTQARAHTHTHVHAHTDQAMEHAALRSWPAGCASCLAASSSGSPNRRSSPPVPRDPDWLGLAWIGVAWRDVAWSDRRTAGRLRAVHSECTSTASLCVASRCIALPLSAQPLCRRTTAMRIALHCIALHCIALHCIALHCIALHWPHFWQCVLLQRRRHKELHTAMPSAVAHKRPVQPDQCRRITCITWSHGRPQRRSPL
jgi:hypothetical protein